MVIPVMLTITLELASIPFNAHLDTTLIISPKVVGLDAPMLQVLPMLIPLQLDISIWFARLLAKRHTSQTMQLVCVSQHAKQTIPTLTYPVAEHV